jgi:proliferating cell nuclear antigen
MNESKNVLTIKTIQIQPIKNIITAIKDILTDATITFTPKYMKINGTDKTNTILVHIMLYSHKFEKFDCKVDKIVIGVNSLTLFRMTNSVTADETMTFYIEEANYFDGVVSQLGVQFDNVNEAERRNNDIPLMDPDMDDFDNINFEYSTIINMPSVKFQKIVRDFCQGQISERVEIRTVGDDLMFKCRGNGTACMSVCRSESADKLNFVQKQDASVVVQGEFSLKSLSQFCKCTPLCDNMELYLDNDMPLLVKYEMSSLGEIKMCLAQLPSV